MPPGRLAIEVTESVFVDADDPALAQLTRLREQGVHVAIDDFGSGFSALAYLSRLPANVLKIDQALTGQVEDARSFAVLQAVVSLAHTMPMAVVVEGIETSVVEGLVQTTGAGYGQGWLYAAAVPIDRLPSTVETVQARRRRRPVASAQTDPHQPVVAGARLPAERVAGQQQQRALGLDLHAAQPTELP
jgi:diguanylate cyclase